MTGRMTMGWTIAGTIVTTGLAMPSAARACSCLPPKSPAVARRAAALVFEGKPVAPPTLRDGQNVHRFVVRRVFSGPPLRMVDVHTPAFAATCGREFSFDTEYLVYADVRADGTYIDSLCSRTRPSKDAAEDFEAFGLAHSTPDAAAESLDRPMHEAPRIEPMSRNSAPPAVTSRRRGCSLGELPHGSVFAWIFGALALAVASVRRRVLP